MHHQILKKNPKLQIIPRKPKKQNRNKTHFLKTKTKP